MQKYVRFTTADETPIFVEVENVGESSDSGGIQDAGAGQRIRETVTTALETFETAASNVLRHSSQAFVDAIVDLDPPPQHVQVTFGLRASGEFGVFTVAKGSGDATYSITLSWTFDHADDAQRSP